MTTKERPKIIVVSNHFSGWYQCKLMLEGGMPIDTIQTLRHKDAIKNNVSGYVKFDFFKNKYDVKIRFAYSLSLTSDNDIQWFKKKKFDLMIVTGWQRLIPAEIINSINVAVLGKHGSSELLPRGRGRSPINWSIIIGRNRFIVHLFNINSGADSGRIIDRGVVRINEFDDVETVYYKTAIVSSRLVLKNYMQIYKHGISGEYQDNSKATYYSKRTDADSTIDWTCSTKDIHNLVRGVARPYPGALSKLNDKKIRIWNVQPFDDNILYPHAQIGELVEVFPNNKLLVNTVDGLLLINEYDYEGKIEKGALIK